MKCAVIGGGGFIGSHLSEALLGCGHEVTVFDRMDARYLDCSREKGATVCIGDFLNPDDLDRALPNCDVVYHMVSTKVPQTSNLDPGQDAEENILGTIRMLDAARKFRVKKIVYASSGGTVYGIPRSIPIEESHPTDPISSYGIGKLAIEKYLHLYWTLHGLDYRILRVANAYGERQPITETQGVISAFLHKAMRREEIVIWGDGSAVRDYVYVSDIVDAFVKAAEYAGEFKVFNIGSGVGHSLNEILDIMKVIHRKPSRVVYKPGRACDVPANVLDIRRAEKHLNWRPAVNLFEGMRQTIEWMSNRIIDLRPILNRPAKCA